MYSFLQDKQGYLWIATDEGVVRYNGYTAQLFNRAEGLTSNDVWTMIDDNSSRVWLGGASGQLGYVHNSTYHPARMHNIKGTVFPYYLHRLDSGIIFSSPYIGSSTTHSICVSKGDTIFPYTVDHSVLVGKDTNFVEAHIHLNAKGELHAASDYFFHVTNLKTIAYPPLKLAITRNHSSKQFIDYAYSNGRRCLLSGNTFIFYTPGLFNYFLLLDANTGISDTVRLSDFNDNSTVEYIAYSIDRAHTNKLFVYTNTHCFVFNFDGPPVLEFAFDFTKIASDEASRGKVIQYLPLPLWDTVIATSNNGVYVIPKNATHKFEKHSELLFSGYHCVGRVYDSITYWWNPQQKKLIHLSRMKVVHSYDLKGYSINNIVEYNTDTLLILGAFNHFLTLKDHRFHSINVGKFGGAVKRLIKYKPASYYILSNAGAYNLRPGYNTDTTNLKYIAIDRFRDAVSDGFRNRAIVWNDLRLLTFNENDSKNFDVRQLSKKADDLIEKVCTEPMFGNIFLKTSNDLLFFDPVSGQTETISTNINYRNCTIEVWENYFVILGDFGVSFFRIEGKRKLSPPITYPNTKKTIYKKIHSLVVAAGELLLQTDKGVLSVKLPAAKDFQQVNYNTVPYRFIVRDNDEHVLNSGDTVRLGNSKRYFYCDVINPLGNGTVRIFYRFGGANDWTKCNGNEIIRPESIIPDEYYKFEMYCEDDGWRSNVVSAVIWVQPTWWQKRSSKYIMWLGVFLLIGLVVVVSVTTTRRLVNRAQQKKQMQIELELKAIYAQINPHFIFNALTSAMLLIKKNKMEEAYMHVSKFSRLLRSYLNSSRNKYISIFDEVTNITNYMELQQARFKDRFEGIITIDDSLDTQCRIPSLLIQPFVENAINHGILPAERNGRIEVTFRPIPNGVQCIVSDNGIGREASKLIHKDEALTHYSYGNLLIKDLIKVFNKYEEMKIDINYRDRKWPDAGTDVIIDICYLH